MPSSLTIIVTLTLIRSSTTRELSRASDVNDGTIGNSLASVVSSSVPRLVSLCDLKIKLPITSVHVEAGTSV